MRLIIVTALVACGSLVAAVALMACADPSIDIVTTQFAQTRATADFATQAALQTIEASGGIDLSNLSGQIRATFAAAATQTAEAKAAGTGDTPTPVVEATPPPGDPLSGSVEVNVTTGGTMDPAVIKVTLGTTVTWVNIDKYAHNVVVTNSDAPEKFQSDNLAWPFGTKQPTRYEHTFTMAGKYEYGSRWQGEQTKAIVWVVEQ